MFVLPAGTATLLTAKLLDLRNTHTSRVAGWKGRSIWWSDSIKMARITCRRWFERRLSDRSAHKVPDTFSDHLFGALRYALISLKSVALWIRKELIFESLHSNCTAPNRGNDA